MLNPSKQAINRWRLVLGKQSDQDLQFSGTDRELQAFRDMEELLDYLYQKGDSEDIRNDPGNSGNSGDSRKGSLDASQLTAAKWITKVRELFPRQTAEVLEKQALEEFHMTELLTDKKVLEQIQPDMDLLKTVLQLKHLMSGEV
ncbi:MAG: hypothetical protein K2O42_03030, partial [Oscillospiraceae bacterium]|nr:hypothetical protein [Oscillospiraceae bacterium]